jgi:hypothetical protein
MRVDGMADAERQRGEECSGFRGSAGWGPPERESKRGRLRGRDVVKLEGLSVEQLYGPGTYLIWEMLILISLPPSLSVSPFLPLCLRKCSLNFFYSLFFSQRGPGAAARPGQWFDWVPYHRRSGRNEQHVALWAPPRAAPHLWRVPQDDKGY